MGDTPNRNPQQQQDDKQRQTPGQQNQQNQGDRNREGGQAGQGQAGQAGQSDQNEAGRNPAGDAQGGRKP